MSKKALIINPYWDTLGGGEKHLASIGEYLIKQGYSLTLPFKSNDFTKGIRDRFDIDLSEATVESSWKALSALERFKYLRQFDIALYATDGSYFFAGAKRNYIYSMYPAPALYQTSVLNKLKWTGWNFITISEFTASYIDKWIGKSSQILHPYIEDDLLISINQKRKPIILNVGRFFGQLHTKNHKALISTFLELKKSHPAYKDYSLCLVGGLKDEDKAYFNELQNLAAKDSAIRLLPNLERNNLIELFREAQYYWHATGLGISVKENPDLVEHFGITPLEAAASGCIVLAHNSGGPRDIFETGVNGFLYDTQVDLLEKMSELSKQKDQKTLRINAHKLVKEHYSYNQFQKSAKKIFGL